MKLVTLWFFCMFFVPLIVYLIVMFFLSYTLYFVDLPKLQAAGEGGDTTNPVNAGAIKNTSNNTSNNTGVTTKSTVTVLTSAQAQKAQKAIKNVLIYPVLMICGWFPALVAFCIVFTFVESEMYWDEKYAQ